MRNFILTTCFTLLPLFSYSQDFSINLLENLDNNHSVPLSNIAKEVKYVPLETTEECLLSNELQIFTGNNDIIIGDQKEQKFYRFDKNGKFLNSIGKRGEGPQEYVYSISFYADNEYVYIIDTKAQKINKYCYDGKFVEKIPLGVTSWSITKDNDNFICYNFVYNRVDGKNKVYELFLLNNKGEVLKKIPTTVESEKDNMLLFTFPFFYKYNGKIFYKNAVTEYVYQLDNQFNLSPVYQIVGGGNNNAKQDYKDIRKYAKSLSVRDIFENNQLIIITYSFKNKLNYFVFDKTTGKGCNAVEGELSGFKDDINDGMLFEPLIGSRSESNCLISMQEAEKIIESNKLQNIESLKSLDYDDNPVLVITTLK